MYNQGFYALFLLLSFGIGFCMLIFGLFARSLFNRKPKPKPLTLKTFRELIPTATTTQKALELVDTFCEKFGIIAPNAKNKDEWLDTVRELTSLKTIDTDEAAKIREQLIKINPNIQKEISDYVGMALKTKKEQNKK